MDTEHLIGQKIDSYRIVKHIARGGMADVYLAEDIVLKRNAALKILLDTLALDAQFVQRFRREAQIVAQLTHPNIVQVFSVGVLPQGAPYIAMQFIDGGSLRDKLRQLATRGKLLTTEQTLNIVRQVALALGVAHKANVVHRDMKPGNVLVRPDGTPVLVDLGIAVVSGGPKLTQTGSLIGTPHYMSPEQVRGKPLDGRSDIYSLGIILYEMLAGLRPFEADESIAVLHQQVYEEPVPLHNYRPDLSQVTLDIVKTCLQKEPSQRYQDTDALIAAIDQALRSEGAIGPNPQVTEVLTYLPDSSLISRQKVVQTPAADAAAISTPEVAAPLESKPPQRRIPIWPIATLFVLAAVIIALFMFQPFKTLTPTPTVRVRNTRPAEIEEGDAATDVVTEVAEADATLALEPEEAAASLSSVPAVATDTAVPTDTLIPTSAPIPTATATPTPVPLPQSTTWELTRSSNNRPLNITQIGNGPKQLVFVGGIHGNEPTTQELVTQMMRHFQENLALVPPGVTLYFLPNLNPDGLVADDRYTPGGVDLNRNWDTPTWVKDSPEPGGIKQNSGGTTPFSEPETAALRNFLLELLNNSQTESVSLIIYHHHAGAPSWGNVQPGYVAYGSPVSPSVELAQALSASSGYAYFPYWDGAYTPTGEAIQWSAMQGIAAVDIELSRDESLHSVPAFQTQTVLQTAIQSVIGLME
jgi:serine/threonine-protein kinase